MHNFEGKTILITGSSRGIGAATARLASKYGAKIILHGKSESPELKKLASELNCEYISCDVTDEKAIVSSLERFDKIDVLVNSAGINISKPFLELTSEIWLETFKVNVLGTVNFSKAVVPKMHKKPGKIVNIASIRGFPASSGRAAYASSKGAIITLTASMAKELAPNVLVNAVAPGFTETEMTEKTWSDRIAKQVEQVLLKRIAKPEEIAEVILFLASEKSNYMVGQTLIVDGGYTLSL